jgi:hypothetical protein
MIREKTKKETVEIDGVKFIMVPLPAVHIDAFWEVKGKGKESDHRARIAYGLSVTVTREDGKPAWNSQDEPLSEDFEVWNIFSSKFLDVNGLATGKN